MKKQVLQLWEVSSLFWLPLFLSPICQAWKHLRNHAANYHRLDENHRVYWRLHQKNSRKIKLGCRKIQGVWTSRFGDHYLVPPCIFMTILQYVAPKNWTCPIKVAQNASNDFYAEEKTLLTTLPFVKDNEINYEKLVTWMGDDYKKYAWIIFLPIVILSSLQFPMEPI